MTGTSGNLRRVVAVLLSGLLLTASYVDWSSPAAAQSYSPPPTSEPGPYSSRASGGGGSSTGRDIGIAAVGVGIGITIIGILLEEMNAPPPPPTPSGPPPGELTYQPPAGPELETHLIHHGGGNNGGGVPPRGERRFVPDEVIVEFSSSASPQSIDQIARRHSLTRLESQSLPLIGVTLYRWHIGGGRSVMSTIGALRKERIVARVQSNYVFALQEQAPSSAGTQGDAGQYVLGKLQIEEAHQIATGKDVLVAVIDSEIDGTHPDLHGTIVKSFDALGGQENPAAHGTAMAGAIAAHGKLLGIAPDAQLLAERAFGDAAKGSSFAIYKSLQWAADNGARAL